MKRLLLKLKAAYMGLLRRLVMFVPVPRNKLADLERNHREHILNLTRRHEEALEERSMSCQKIIKRCHKISYEHIRDDRYAVMVEFSVELLGGVSDPYQRHYIARTIAKQIEVDIATARFIQKARH